MAAIFTTDTDKARVEAAQALLARVTSDGGADISLGSEIVDALGAPAIIGDPTSSVDAALWLADWIGQDRAAVMQAASEDRKRRVATGADLGCDSDPARIVCAMVLRLHIADLDRRPL